MRLTRLLPAAQAVVVALVLAVATLASLAPASLAATRPVGRPYETRSVVYARHGMAATSQPLATQAALQVLRQGGTAVDAAIAANAVLGLVEPTGNGIGGDLFAIVWDPKTRRLHGLNGSGRSPRGLSYDQLRAELAKLGVERIPAHGPLPVSVPGAVDGWFALHGRFGRLPMKTVLAPAIGYAREGFPVTPVIAQGWERGGKALAKWPGFADTYLPGGRAPAAGEVFRNPRLAATLEQIAKGGRDAFYQGDIARRIDAYMRANGGYLRYEDLAAHRSEWVEPVSTNYRGYDVWQLPPNGQGLAVLQMLNLLEPYDLASMDPQGADYVHLFTEAKKLAYEDRARWYADPDFAKQDLRWLISKDYARERGKLIRMDTASREIPPGAPPAEPPPTSDTIYMTVADDSGMMVSLIQSNYRGMGSGMTPGDLGFVLQDRGEMFSLDPAHPNAYAPGKRPFHTIIPGFVTRNGAPWLAFGVMGGAVQPQGQVQVLVNLIDFGLNLQEAGDSPRIRHDGSSEPTGERMVDGGQVVLERGFPAAVYAELRRRGHVVKEQEGDFGGYQAILRHPLTGVYQGATESRKDGQAAGY